MLSFVTQKTYYDFVKEITADELYRGLMVHGLFAEKLPPFLSGEAFYSYVLSMSTPFPEKPRQYIYYESIRDTNVPRPMGIPHPFAHQNLCHCLRDNWERILEYFREKTANQRHKISRIHLRKMNDDPRLFEMNYNDWRTDPSPEVDLMMGKHYFVNADISNCFPSIYTHALPWALVGKDHAKKNRKNTHWFNQIDTHTRNIKHGETHGLLIGPHVSNLLSEIILTAVDEGLYQQNWQFVRFIDDYKCYTKTFEEAERFIVVLNKHLHYFGLTLNHKKTFILPLPQVTEEQWVRKINSFDLVKATETVNYKEARAFLDSAVELAYENGSRSSILNYAIKILCKKKLTDNARIYSGKRIPHLAHIYPYLVSLLDEFVFMPLQLGKDMIARFSNDLFETEMERANYEAVNYAIYFALKHRFELKKLDVQRIIESNNCLVLLLAQLYYLYRCDKHFCCELKKHALLLCANDEDFEQNWLFVYETLPAGRLRDEWKQMKRSGISFVDKKQLNR